MWNRLRNTAYQAEIAFEVGAEIDAAGESTSGSVADVIR